MGLRDQPYARYPFLPLKIQKGNYDVIIKCNNGRFAVPATFLTARALGKPFILIIDIWTRIRTAGHQIMFPLFKYILKHADAVITHGAHMKDYVIGEGVDPGKIFVAPYAIDNLAYSQPVQETAIQSLRSEMRLHPEHKTILYLGRHSVEKGISFLLTAFAQLKQTDTVLILAGEGPERQNLESLSQRLGITDRVRFPGYIPIPKTREYYAIADVFVLPSISTSHGKETWGIVVNEALNQGVPVIATDAVGAVAGGLVQHGINGLVVPEKNPAALAQTLDKLLTDHDLHHSLSLAARSSVAGWTSERSAAGYQQAIDYVLRRRA